MYKEKLKDLKVKSDEVIEKIGSEFKNIHTGRASGTLVENIMVDYYGQRTPVKQMAQVTTPDSNNILITPWDANNLGDIENAIRNSDIGVNPVNDGKSVRVTLPPLTEERRKEYADLASKMAEEGRVAVRNLRSDVWNEVKKMEKDGDLTEDDRYDAEEELNKVVKEYNDKIESMLEEKKNDLMKV